MVLLGVISLVPRGSVTANDGAVTYYAQYGRTLHARAAAEARKHMAGTVDCDSRMGTLLAKRVPMILVVLLGLLLLYEGYI